MRETIGKVAVITGGSSGIGRGIALAFARAGMKVTVTGRRTDHLEETVAIFAEQGLDVYPMQVDVTDLAAMRAAADEIEQRFGRIHVLVNNAGIGLTGPVSQATSSDWDWAIDVNIKGVANGIQAFLPKIRSHGEGGHIVNTSSMAGLMPIVAGIYSMTKAAVIALSEALHLELLSENIGVSAYCPGPTHSNIAQGVANRPAEYGQTGYPVGPHSAAPATKLPPYMSAEEAGERVLQGVIRGDMFILTHPEFKAGVVDRHATIEAAFPDEPLDDIRSQAIGFLLGSPVYSPENRLASPTPAARVSV
ncbi:SDR family NAD(P)-dependent oxidoreductase [Cryobacterium sp. Hh7]|uniref:SDR family NAD(P)-dependent oxidoreductase n=1 Tax=Cryobacterium sp. Hh7 TaxID=1259159 RepID=UPI0010695890|nr:SDR family NAD(P)-dependent oxidoreductase [Cryobacterium sp. Hh7]TFD59702.1 SDR family NAD(P)-dependent oxidoreductase [Cryobacterium sp. Hh7]